MDKHSKKILDLFYERAKNIPGLYDIVLRGSGSKKNSTKLFVEGWSDLDFSIIVEDINKEVRENVKEIYSYLRKHTDMKITIILVNTEDFFKEYHLHGMKDMYYIHSFPYYESLFRKDTNYACREMLDPSIYKLSSYFFISYLIHDLRKQYISSTDSISDIRSFFYTLSKRANTISWTAIFLKTGERGPDTSHEKLFSEYPKLDKDFWKNLQLIKATWSEIKNNSTQMNAFIEYIFDNIEYLYSEVHTYIESMYSTPLEELRARI